MTPPPAVATPPPLTTPRAWIATPFPRRTPGPEPTATSDPHLFTLGVRPDSVSRVEVEISGSYHLAERLVDPERTLTPSPTPIPTASPTPRPNAAVTPMPMPTPTRATIPPPLIETNASTALEVFVTDVDGRTVARGRRSGAIEDRDTEEVVSFDLDRALEPSADPYVIVARWKTAPEISASVRYAISAVPKDDAIGVGDRYFEDAGTDRLRRDFALLPLRTIDTTFFCSNRLGESAQAELLPGKSLVIDTIVRAAHVVHALPNDPHRRPFGFERCDDGCASTYVDSPLVVKFRIAPDDVRIFRPPVITRPWRFHGNCTRGVLELADERQFAEVFARIDAPSP